VVIEYGLAAEKMEIIARTAYRVIAMHRSQYGGSSLATFDFRRRKKLPLEKNGVFKISVIADDTRH